MVKTRSGSDRHRVCYTKSNLEVRIIKMKYFKIKTKLHNLTCALVVTIFLGVNKPYDEALDDIKTCKNWFDQYLDKQRKRLSCRVSTLTKLNKLVSLFENLFFACLRKQITTCKTCLKLFNLFET